MTNTHRGMCWWWLVTGEWVKTCISSYTVNIRRDLFAVYYSVACLMCHSQTQAALVGCARYPSGHGCRAMFWTESRPVARVSFRVEADSTLQVLEHAVTTLACLRWDNWHAGEPNDSGSNYNARLQYYICSIAWELSAALSRMELRVERRRLRDSYTCSVCEIDLLPSHLYIVDV